MNIIAFDPGQHCGWARCYPGNSLSLPPCMEMVTVDYGTELFKQKTKEFDSLKLFRHMICQGEYGEWSPDLVVYEDVPHHPPHVSTAVIHAYGGYRAILRAVCDEHCIKHVGVNLSTIKLHATGNGHATKPDVIAAMRERGFDPKDDNAADALALLLYALDNYKKLTAPKAMPRPKRKAKK